MYDLNKANGILKLTQNHCRFELSKEADTAKVFKLGEIGSGDRWDNFSECRGETLRWVKPLFTTEYSKKASN
jgi:hypothetical protein